MLLSKNARVLGLVAIVLGLLGSVIGIWCALSAFQAVGTNPAYSGRLWAAWAAFLLPILAALATLFLRTHPLAAGLLIIVNGLAGAVCINLFYINTFYVLAIPLWILAVAVGIASHSRTNSGQRIQDE